MQAGVMENAGELRRDSSPMMAAAGEPQWYVASVCPRHEKQVARQLQERHVAHFLPLYRSVRRWKDRRKELDMVLFPGYVFVQIDLRDRMHVLQLPSVVRFVSFNGRPAPLPERDLGCLMRGLDAGMNAEPHPFLKAGRRVRIKSGPLESAEGVLLRRKNRWRLVLSVDLIMRSVAVELDEVDVECC